MRRQGDPPRLHNEKRVHDGGEDPPGCVRKQTIVSRYLRKHCALPTKVGA